MPFGTTPPLLVIFAGPNGSGKTTLSRSYRLFTRHLTGGHNVPEEDIRRRYKRSIANAKAAISMTTFAQILDNSDQNPVVVADFESGHLAWRAEQLPGWAAGIVGEFG